jgi:hypothetical protein
VRRFSSVSSVIRGWGATSQALDFQVTLGIGSRRLAGRREERGIFLRLAVLCGGGVLLCRRWILRVTLGIGSCRLVGRWEERGAR